MSTSIARLDYLCGEITFDFFLAGGKQGKSPPPLLGENPCFSSQLAPLQTRYLELIGLAVKVEKVLLNYF